MKQMNIKCSCKLFQQKEYVLALKYVYKKLNEKHKHLTLEHMNLLLLPQPNKVFRAFEYFDIIETKVIILGQDPYPNPKNASGLSFSSDGKGIPASLRNIYKCLLYQGFINKTPKSANLEPWAKQGVLLLNRYLTRTCKHSYVNGKLKLTPGRGIDLGVHQEWSVFTNFLLRHLSQIPWGRPVYLCLWGRVSQEVKAELDEYSTLTVLEWGHPSPMNRVNQDDGNKHNFKYCDHFAKIHETYPELSWSV